MTFNGIYSLFVDSLGDTISSSLKILDHNVKFDTEDKHSVNFLKNGKFLISGGLGVQIDSRIDNIKDIMIYHDITDIVMKDGTVISVRMV